MLVGLYRCERGPKKRADKRFGKDGNDDEDDDNRNGDQ